MKLIELKPKWIASPRSEKGYLQFECPEQHTARGMADMKCIVMLPISPEPGTNWDAMGDTFDNLTLSPSIWHHCEKNPHFFIRNGEIQYA